MNDHIDPHSQHDEAGPVSGPISGMLDSIKQVLATLLSMAQTRLELFTTELQDEVYRLAVSLLWSLAALFAFGISLFLAALTVIFIFWDTHRVLVSVIVTLAFLCLAALAARVATKRISQRPQLLQATLSELKRDQEILSSRQ